MMNTNIFAESARKSTSLSDVMNGRTKVSISDIIKGYPAGITLTDFDIVTMTDKGREVSYPVFLFAESESEYFNGGAVLAKIVNGWCAMFEGDVDETREKFRESGGVKVKMEEGRTKTGNNIVKVNVIG